MFFRKVTHMNRFTILLTALLALNSLAWGRTAAYAGIGRRSYDWNSIIDLKVEEDYTYLLDELYGLRLSKSPTWRIPQRWVP
jgi:hypothetical protein